MSLLRSNSDRAEFARCCTAVRQLHQGLQPKTVVSPVGTFMRGKKKEKKNQGTNAITHHYHSRLMAGHALRR